MRKNPFAQQGFGGGFIDCDAAKGFTHEEINKNRTKMNVYGFGEKKIGNWDSKTQTKIKEIAKKEMENKKPKKIAQEEEDETEVMNSAEVGLDFDEYLQAISKKDVPTEPEIKISLQMQDPLSNLFAGKTENQPKKNYIEGPPNRFGIKPGPWWDGIDRSNGFEKRRADKISESKAKKDDEYRKSLLRL